MEIKSSKLLCYIAFHTLENFLDKQKPDQQLIQKIPKVDVPLFVTYHINDDELRGCIGNLQGLDLQKGLPEYSIIAAVQDHRFSPITKHELPKLNVAVSLLVNYEEASNALDWEVGKHGILIKYNGHSATFLPEVAAEQQWDQKTTLQHLLQKAGVREKLNPDMIAQIKCTRYQSSKEQISYAEYLKMKELDPKLLQKEL